MCLHKDAKLNQYKWQRTGCLYLSQYLLCVCVLVFLFLLGSQRNLSGSENQHQNKISTPLAFSVYELQDIVFWIYQWCPRKADSEGGKKNCQNWQIDENV